VVYATQTLEMVLDAHVRAFEFFGGACRKGIYDNLKTVVSKVLLGRDRVFNRRFQNLASHYLFEPVACTPAAGWEKGQVERQVGFVRQRFFAKRRKFADLDELTSGLPTSAVPWLPATGIRSIRGRRWPRSLPQNRHRW
jgi:transposase